MLPLNSEVISLYVFLFFFLRNSLSDSHHGFFNKIPAAGNIKKLFKDVFGLWKKSDLPIVSKERVEVKLKELIDRYTAARKKALIRGDEKIDEVWLKNLFDLQYVHVNVLFLMFHQFTIKNSNAAAISTTKFPKKN